MKAAVFSIVLSVSLLMAGEYQVDKSQTNMVKFISDAPIEDFEGVTDKIDGFLYWRGSDFTSESDIYLEVDLNSLDTGIGLRNRHMRENYLETDKYPITYYKGKIISSNKNAEGSFTVKADGSIFIHGVNQPLKVSGVIISEAQGYHVQVDFIVKLTDFNIEVPSIMFYKIDEAMTLKLDFYLKKMSE